MVHGATTEIPAQLETYAQMANVSGGQQNLAAAPMNIMGFHEVDLRPLPASVINSCIHLPSSKPSPVVS
jgi:hypothetical protein